MVPWGLKEKVDFFYVFFFFYRLRERLRESDRLRDLRPLRERDRLREFDRERERLRERPTSRSPSSLIESLRDFPLISVPCRVSMALYNSSREL